MKIMCINATSWATTLGWELTEQEFENDWLPEEKNILSCQVVNISSPLQ